MVIKVLTLELLPNFFKTFSELMHEGYGSFPSELQEYFLSKDYGIDRFTYWLNNNLQYLKCVVDDNNNVIAFIVANKTYGGVGFVDWLGVIKEYRKGGWGTKLLKEYEEFVKSVGGHLIELSTYEASKPFYIKHGYQEIGRREKGYFKQLNIIMNKTIS